MEINKVAEEWEIWDEEEEAVKSEVEAKKMVPKKFHQWIKVFRKKQSERMLMRKVWDHAIEVKKGSFRNALVTLSGTFTRLST